MFLVVLICLLIRLELSEGRWDTELPLLLWTQSNPVSEDVLNIVEGGEELFLNDLNRSHFNPQVPIKILLHGFMDQGRTSWLLGMKNSILDIMDANVFSLDWRFYSGSMPLYYPMSVAKIHMVGNLVSKFMEAMIKKFNINSKEVHIIGFSLGAQIGGVIANSLSSKVGRVTGLDPAGFIFKFINNNSRISSNSAHFVDIIHTTSAFVGLFKPIGHIDFYPNSGKRQPGCESENMFTKRCSHFYSVKLFYQSIANPRYFTARKCKDWTEYNNGKCWNEEKTHLGFHVSNTSRGIFFLHTSPKLPYNLQESITDKTPIHETFLTRFVDKIASFFGK